jgi:methylenetetrahydrofolate reductase (NADPH)
MTALAPPDFADLQARVMALASGASIEITPHDSGAVAQLATILGTGSTVYVAHTPSVSLTDVVATALSMQTHGLNAVPHLVARRISGNDELTEAVTQLQAAGVRRVLAVAGDTAAAAGPFESSLDILGSPAFTQAPFPEVAVAAHPEGHPLISDAALWSVIIAKRDYARRSGVALTLLTQFGFDLGALADWDRRLIELGIDLPVVVGIAGPAPLGRLLNYARRCGVSKAVRSAIDRPSVLRLATGQVPSPGEIFIRLALRRDPQETRIRGLHLFSFGGTLPTARWLQTVRRGLFRITPRQSSLELLA